MRPAQFKTAEGDRIASDFVRLLFDYLENRGIAAPALLGVPRPARDSGPGATYPLQQWRAMLELARTRLGDPLLGLHLGQTITPSHFGMLGYLLLNSANLGEALTVGNKYLRLLLQRSMQMHVHARDASISIEWEMERETLDALSMEVHLSALAALTRNISGQSLPMESVRFTHSRCGEQEAYDDYFGCRVLFDQPVLGARFPASYLRLPVRNADPDLLILLANHANAVLDSLPSSSDSLKHAVQGCIVRIMHSAEPGIEQVAELMHMSPRTLQRRLDENNLNFRQLLDETRLRLAQAYLNDPRLQIKDVAHLLGFSEQSAFNRAFKRWTGISPGQFAKTQTDSL